MCDSSVWLLIANATRSGSSQKSFLNNHVNEGRRSSSRKKRAHIRKTQNAFEKDMRRGPAPNKTNRTKSRAAWQIARCAAVNSPHFQRRTSRESAAKLRTSAAKLRTRATKLRTRATKLRTRATKLRTSADMCTCCAGNKARRRGLFEPQIWALCDLFCLALGL